MNSNRRFNQPHTDQAPRTVGVAAVAAFVALMAFTFQCSATAVAQELTARDTGARYGQALGALEICHGSKLTEKAKGLEATFSGDDLTAFKDQAAKILKAWMGVKTCSNQLDPNQCKLMMDASCGAARSEIGPKGTALPGLLDFP